MHVQCCMQNSEEMPNTHRSFCAIICLPVATIDIQICYKVHRTPQSRAPNLWAQGWVVLGGPQQPGKDPQHNADTSRPIVGLLIQPAPAATTGLWVLSVLEYKQLLTPTTQPQFFMHQVLNSARAAVGLAT